MNRQSSLRWQAVGGLLLFLACYGMGTTLRWEPFHTYLYLFAWGAYLWIIDRTLAARLGDSPMQHPGQFIWMMGLSTTVWLIFEVINLRIQNWAYIGIPVERAIRWTGYAFSFATVIPGILMTCQLIEAYVKMHLSNEKMPGDPGRAAGWSFLTGFLMLFLPLAWPRYFFPLVWGSFFFLLEPLVQRWGGHSLLADWKAKRWRRTRALLLAGLICGLFWEGCNFGAGAKWVYTIPFVGFGKVFEMPFLGFLGFLPFALEVHAFYETARLGWQRLPKVGRGLIVLAQVFFWMVVFAAIDRMTVVSWK